MFFRRKNSESNKIEKKKTNNISANVYTLLYVRYICDIHNGSSLYSENDYLLTIYFYSV